MSRRLSDLHDVQGLVRGYGSEKFPVGRFFFIGFKDYDRTKGLLRAFLDGISTAGRSSDGESVTSSAAASGRFAIASALEWTDGPPAHRLNIAFTHAGLQALEVPWEVLDSFPREFKIGMARRASVTGDNGPSAPRYWDRVWQDGGVHAWIGLYARDRVVLGEATAAVREQVDQCDCDRLYEQPVNHLREPDQYPIEHFGFADGISNPPVDGVNRDGNFAGGRLDKTGQWQAMAAGEFILGPYQDEIAERPKAPNSDVLVTNGSFMVYRKLQQDVDGFRTYISDEASRLRIDPELLAAKMVGRHRDGTPLVDSPHLRKRRLTADNPVKPSNDFVYDTDPQGERCPLGSHIRRANPRGTFGFGTELVNRHRMLRRGIPYGYFVPNGKPADEVNPNGQGLIFIALNASIERQFEFVQQQWINFGDSLFQGSDKDPVAGDSTVYAPAGSSPATADNQFRFWNEHDHRLNICTNIPRFVVTKGGDYFFLPSIRALRYLASDRRTVQ